MENWFVGDNRDGQGKICLAGAGVSLSEEFVAAVHGRLPDAVRLALWVLREVTRIADPQPAAALLVHLVDVAIRATPQGQTISAAMLAQIRPRVIEELLGPRGRVTLAGADLAATAPGAPGGGIPPPGVHGCAGG